MFSIAYRMLGSVAEAEDVVQEAFLRMYREPAKVDSWEASPQRSPQDWLSINCGRLACLARELRLRLLSDC